MNLVFSILALIPIYQDNLMKIDAVAPQNGNMKPTSDLISKFSQNAKYIIQYPCNSENSCFPYECTLGPGQWKIEAWGTQGNMNNEIDFRREPGKGAYVSGEIRIKTPSSFYFYLGSQKGLYNGGGDSNVGSSGGSATDIRLIDGEWNNFQSLLSRIMVAGGGGGQELARGGNGGGLSGEDCIDTYYENYERKNLVLAKGGTQRNGGAKGTSVVSGINVSGNDGGFGYGGRSYISTFTDQSAGGGAGYFGGGSVVWAGCGGGGSSFISGHSGCVAYSQSASTSSMNPLPNSTHYSGIVFRNTQMINGNQTMPMPEGGEGKGIIGDGIIKITLLNPSTKPMTKTSKTQSNSIVFLYAYLVIT